MPADFNLNDQNRWGWGVLGRSLELNGSTTLTIPDIFHADSNFTISAWLNPGADFQIFSRSWNQLA